MSSTKKGLVRYAVIETPLGWCGLAAADRGVVRIFLPEPTRPALLRAIRRRCSGALESGGLGPQAAHLQRYFATGRLAGAWRLDLRGSTIFQQRVWDVLRRIPRGEVRTYGWIAAELGMPGAARAVGSAAGANPFPVVVPCHRLVRASGELGGFSATGGWALKAEMLRREGVAVRGQRVEVNMCSSAPDAGARPGQRCARMRR